MRFPPSFLDEIKARLPVSEVVRRHVKLAKAGRELVGLSPFGQERTPSFFVNDQKMAWFDMSAGKNGNIFDFVMQTEGLSFPETVERLAAEAGLALPERSPERERQEQRRAGLHEVLEWAAALFERNLAGAGGARARAYLDSRGIGMESRATFRIGYAPAERYALRDALAAKDASVAVMCEAGLLIHGEDITVPYDRFRDRVIFPIADRSGKVIAFGGRSLEKDVQPKYLNSPETPLFHKGHVLFNHHRARKAAHDKGRVIAVEGYVDVVAMHAAGFPETVAGLGTALTEEQAGLLWSMAPQPLLCFDGDKAGRKAAYRAAEMALPMIGPRRTLAFVLLPDGQDPDDLIRTAGPGAMQALLEAARPLVELLWSRQVEDRRFATPEERAALQRELDGLAALIRDEPLRRHYHADFKDRCYQLFRAQRQTFGAQRAREPYAQAPYARKAGRTPDRQTGYLSAPLAASASLMQSMASRQAPDALAPREAMIMTILLAHPVLVEDEAEALAGLDFSAPELAALRDRMLDLAHHDLAPLDGAPLDGVVDEVAHDDRGARLRAALAAAGFASTLAKLEKSGVGSMWYAQTSAALQDAGAVLRQALTLHRKTRALHRELLSAETALASDASEPNMARMRDIQEQLNALAGMEAAVDGFGALSGRSGPAL